MAADTLVGGSEDNTYLVDDVGDIVRALSGTDTIQTTLNGYTLQIPVAYDPNYPMYDNRIERLEFIGNGDFKGTGSMSSDTIIGSDGNDTLDGGLGADILMGGDGNDVLYGTGIAPANMDDGSVDTLVG